VIAPECSGEPRLPADYLPSADAVDVPVGHVQISPFGAPEHPPVLVGEVAKDH
jgi:hypothetical protein